MQSEKKHVESDLQTSRLTFDHLFSFELANEETDPAQLTVKADQLCRLSTLSFFPSFLPPSLVSGELLWLQAVFYF